MDRWFDGLLVRWIGGSVVLGSLDRWFDGLVVQWFAGSKDRWFDGSLVRWIAGSVVCWFDGSMDRWFDVVSSSSSEDHFFKKSCKLFSILSEGGVGFFLVFPISFSSRKHNVKSLIMTCLTSLSSDVTSFLGIFSKILFIAWNKSSLIKTLLPNMAFILVFTVQQLSIIMPSISCCAF